VYHDGLPVWKKGKKPLFSTVNGLNTFNEKGIPYVLIDVRAASETAGGVIPGAVTMAAGSLETMKAEFPRQKSAPVIVYGSPADAEKAFATVRGWGFKNASILDGGTGAWVAAGNALTETSRPKIAYAPKPRPGEIAVSDFRKAADGGSGESVVLDVRGTDETSQGMIKSAVNIPLTELSGRLGELPKGKQIIAQCNTGAQAEMAYNLLKEAGYTAGWINAKITVKGDGTYSIEDN